MLGDHVARLKLFRQVEWNECEPTYATWQVGALELRRAKEMMMATDPAFPVVHPLFVKCLRARSLSRQLPSTRPVTLRLAE